VDLSDAKLERARDFGATHTINPSSLDGDAGDADATGEDQPVVQAVHEVLGGVGADVVVDAVGLPATFTQAFYMRDLAGRVVLVGVPTPEMTVQLPFVDVFSRGGAVKSSWYGDCLPERDFPMYTELYLQGRFPLGEFVDERVGIDAVESAFAKMKQGSVLRSVVEL
jgi:S-(hydroxymethyl)mycothiol dehydrogenase